MLIACPECGLQVSDKAMGCPHCGYPISGEEKRRGYVSTKRRRLPNGFGQISKIKDKNLRKPYRAMVTIGKDDTGKPITKLLKPDAYFKTYNEAYTALVEYNKKPYDYMNNITIGELYQKWSEEYYKGLNKSTIKVHTSAWNYCVGIKDLPLSELRNRHIKWCMTEATVITNGVEHTASSNMQLRIKNVFNLMLDYATEYELIDKNQARSFKPSKGVSEEAAIVKNEHICFTDEEMSILWKNVDNLDLICDVVLIQCYTGLRPNELAILKLENVDIEAWEFHGGLKTAAGKNRIIPIHPKIRRFVRKRYEYAVANNLSAFIYINEKECTYERYASAFFKIRDTLGLNPMHRPHDCRVQFVTMAKKYNVDDFALKYIIGHKIADITERVYTKRNSTWLAEEISKIEQADSEYIM